MSKHTKAPWQVNTLSGTYVIDNSDRTICKCGGTLNPTEEDEANAALKNAEQ